MKALPNQLLRQLQNVTGFNEAAFISAHQQVGATSVRMHPVKGNGLFATNEQVSWCAEGRYLPERPVFTIDPAYHAGAYYVQEASSMFLHHILKQVLAGKGGLKILDLCAAPGGKSTLIASLLDEESLLVANDVIKARAGILEENLTRWGYMNTWVASNDPRDFGRLPGYFDVIIADAPCSGSGLFRKDEKALDEWSEANVQLCSQRQQRILADVWPALKEDGILIYATCSYSPEEDEAILKWLADTYSVESVAIDVPVEWGIVKIESTGMQGYRFFPDKVMGEGFFVAALIKKESSDSVRVPRFKSAADKTVQKQAEHFFTANDIIFLPNGRGEYTSINAVHEADFQLLTKALYFRKAGCLTGQPGNKEWIPAHDIALSINTNNALPAIEVNKENALRYLKKEDLQGLPEGKGWHIVKYNGLGLGWIKMLGSRTNNYLPKSWRIRMEITDADWA